MKTGTSWRSVIYAGSFVVANHRCNLSFGEVSSTAFLVYVAAILLYKPIFTQPLGFFLCAAGAVEKSATERAVSVVYSRDSIDISKINAAFLTGQQIDRIHVQQLLLPSFMCQEAQRLLLYHVPSPKTIAFLTKDTHKNFSFQKCPTSVEQTLLDCV